MFLCYSHPRNRGLQKENVMSNDTKRPPRWRRIGRVTHAFLVYYTVGIWFYLFWILPYKQSGRLIVHGQDRYKAALARGRVAIVANHPSVVESYFLSVLLCGSFWKSIPELWPYSLPDPASFLPRWLWWFFPLIRCVTVERHSTTSRRRALYRSIELLKQGECIVIHPEGGRTNKGTSFLCGMAGRRIRVPLEQGVATIITSLPDIEVLPVWIDVQGDAFTGVLSYREALARGLTITVGEPFVATNTARGKEGRRDLLVTVAEQVLNTTE